MKEEQSMAQKFALVEAGCEGAVSFFLPEYPGAASGASA